MDSERIQFRPEAFDELMAQRGLGVGQFAKMIGVTRALVFAWSKAACSPQIGTLVRVCNTFEVPITYFFGKVERKQSEKIAVTATA